MGCTNFMHKKYLNFVIFSLALFNVPAKIYCWYGHKDNATNS